MKPRVVIVGGGFGGLNAIKALATADIDLRLIDRKNHHLFQPLLYQVATAALAPSNIAMTFREVLYRQKNVSILLSDVLSVNLAEKSLTLSNGERCPYDWLILAPGAGHNYFGHDEWEKLAPGLKSIDDAILIRNRILLSFEKAESADSRKAVERHLTFVIIGGGPTGVEMAGAIAEISHKTFFRNFREIKPEQSKIYLIEGGERLLPAYSEKLSLWTKESLEKLGVAVRLGQHVGAIGPTGVQVGKELIETENVIWAAGSRASPLIATLGLPTDRMGRVPVLPDLSLPDHPNVFVIGDAASCTIHDAPLPAIAPVAMQQGLYAASIIAKQLPAEKRPPFVYVDKGSLATIGKAKAVGAVGKHELTGYLAWLAWSVIHIMYLISFRAKIIVATQWVFWYITGKCSSRLITGYGSRDSSK